MIVAMIVRLIHVAMVASFLFLVVAVVSALSVWDRQRERTASSESHFEQQLGSGTNSLLTCCARAWSC
jgi:heme/copper-type cytochrome/quinol oxidase subunit 2